MHYLSPVLILMLPIALPAADQGQAKPRALSPKEAGAGWILLFDGETTFGWKIEGEAQVSKGVLVLGGTKATTAETTTALNWTAKDWPDASTAALESKWTGNESPTWSYAGSSGSWTRQGQTDFTASDFKQKGPTAVVTPLTFKVPPGSKLFLRNVKFQPGGLKSIFNGKDLTGWKEFPGKKSRFSVTSEGWLNVKNGPGDLQTEGQWKDFVLQIDVFSNGKHLNSGVFFRCIPGQYQNGYEAQIRNQWQGGDRTKPVDYGTGGIQYRQPARKVVSNDLEWFTMTIAARGPHLAIWVNGYQTADFTDLRPPSDNARKGCKLGAGPISLQGHDPTTDLSFRNIRIVELPGRGG